MREDVHTRKTIIACEALSRELTGVLDELSFKGRVVYLPAALHLRPRLLAAELEAAIDRESAQAEEVIVIYGKCIPDMDGICKRKGAGSIPFGEHCFQMYLGDEYERIIKEEPGTYFLTPHFAENFDDLCLDGLGIRRYPKLKAMMFGHYKKALFIDTKGGGAMQAAKDAAACLGLPLEYVYTGVKCLKDVLLSSGMGCKQGKGGCLFGNTALEMSDTHKQIAVFIGKVFDEWVDKIRKVIQSAQASGQLRDDISPGIMARHIVMTIEGGIMLARVKKNEKMLRECLTSLRALVGLRG